MLYAGTAAGSWPASSAHCACQSRSIIFGRRWMTTFRKLPTARPAIVASVTKPAGWARASRRVMAEGPQAPPAAPSGGCARLYRLAELENGQVHGHDHAAAQHAEDDHDHGLHERGQR